MGNFLMKIILNYLKINEINFDIEIKLIYALLKIDLVKKINYLKLIPQLLQDYVHLNCLGEKYQIQPFNF